MQQNRSCGRKLNRSAVRAKLLRAALSIAFIGLVIGLDASTVRAADGDTSNESAWNRVMQRLGLKKPPGEDSSDINYTERSPLVVPPTRDLPPPATSAALAPDWPKDPRKPPKRAAAKPDLVPETAVQTPNPPVVKKPWYNPTGWFSKEEYGNFAGEPVRQSLTDPPAGYRIPSPNQPYGIGPDKKPARNPTAQDLNLGSATPPPTQGGK